MKKISLLFAFVALLSTASFAKGKKTDSKSIVKKEMKAALKQKSCKVSVSYGGTTLTMTATCDCTQQQACDLAYAALSIVIPD
jgi:hypothetical protein